MADLLDTNNDGIAISGASDTIPKELLERAPTIETLRKRFDDARELTQTGRARSQMGRDYFDGEGQLTPEVKQLLRGRGQPLIYTNRIRPAVNGILGVLEMSRSDPKGVPRNPDDEQAAPIGTKALRFIADECSFAETSQEVAENFFIEGTGAVLVELDEDRKIVATQIRWEEYYYDPYARKNDLSDKRYDGVAKWTDVAAIREKYAVRLNEIGDPMLGGRFLGLFGGTTWDDRPDGLGWVDRRRHRILLVEEYHLQGGTWMRCVYIATGILEYGISPWLDDKGRPCNPIESVSCYVGRENRRYGIVDDMLPIQDEINSRRSRSLHLSNNSQIQQADSNAPPVDAETARAEAKRADGVLPPGWVKASTAEMNQANINLLIEAKGEIERMSPTPLARDLNAGSAVSGRARLVAQQAGQAEIARPLARLKNWRLRVYKQFWNRARQYWTQPMWVRTTDELRATEFLKINEPVLGPVMQPVTGPDGQPIIDPATGMPAMQEGIGVVEVRNRPAEIGMDIILDEAPDTVALQEEVFAELMELIRAGVSPFSEEFEFLVEMSPMTDKGRLLERLQKRREAQQQGQGEAQAKAAAIAEAQATVDIQNKAADTEKKQAETAKIEVETMIASFEAGQSSVPEPPKEPVASSGG